MVVALFNPFCTIILSVLCRFVLSVHCLLQIFLVITKAIYRIFSHPTFAVYSQTADGNTMSLHRPGNCCEFGTAILENTRIEIFTF